MISAVGHETDTTLIDFVSDLRAPTPSAAAEKAVPVRDELVSRIDELNLRIKSSFNNKLNSNKDRINYLKKLLGKPDQIFEQKIQKLDFIYKDFENLLKGIFIEKKNKITQYAQCLLPPKVLIGNLVSKQQLLETKFKNRLENIMDRKETKLDTSGQLLEASSFKRVLERGFTLVMNNKGKPIKLSSEAPKNTNIKIKFSDEIRTAHLDK